MLNLRKLRQDFSSSILRDGKTIFEEKKVLSAKILELDTQTMRISAQIQGQYDNAYETEIEIDRLECETIDSNCDCPYAYDCQHLAALMYYLEANLDKILVEYSQATDLEAIEEGDNDESKAELLKHVQKAATKEEERKDQEYRRQLLEEYVTASKLLSESPFFLKPEKLNVDRAELAMIFKHVASKKQKDVIEIQIALRLPSRSKPLHISNLKEFLLSLRFNEPIYVSGKKFTFTLDSFQADYQEMVRMVMDHARFPEKTQSERALRLGYIDPIIFGSILAKSYAIGMKKIDSKKYQDEDLPFMPCLYHESLEKPLLFSPHTATFRFDLEYIEPPAKKILINPCLLIGKEPVTLENVELFECTTPGMLYEGAYYAFPEHVTRRHLKNLHAIRDMTLPEHLFGSFIENAIPQLSVYADISHREVTNKFVTLPYTGEMRAVCDITFLNGELDATLHFKYDDHLVPANASQLLDEHLDTFITDSGIMARNLVEEREIIDDLFRDFVYNKAQSVYLAKSEKKIVEFMTETIPRNQERVQFNCPQNLLDQFIYDESSFTLKLSHTDRMDVYKLELIVDGALQGVKMDRLWECLVSKKAFIELKKSSGNNKIPKILVLDLDKIGGVVQLFDELGVEKLDNYSVERPIWSLANIDASNFEGLPVKFSCSDRLMEVRSQMLGEKTIEFSPMPTDVKATLRGYQVEGVQWLERLRGMYLNGILADDMGLGKTVQAITSVTQHMQTSNKPVLIVCPTSLLYNWKEEFHRFNPKVKTLVVDGIPNQRKKLIGDLKKYDVIITSYSLLQKDIEAYQATTFSYAILDEAQHIKNRGTRNAKSVKMIKSDHRLILSGTPIENSLDELWSLFDFLMPGFLSSYERFTEKYIRVQGDEQTKNLQYLRKKVAPFVMRRMKADVLKDLPPVDEIVYHTQLSDAQNELYRSYAESALGELKKLVERDGFDKCQIHVLATLTRLKQICCHPAIFAKEAPESGDSAKYEMLLDLLDGLNEGGHKTVIFSQYTKMLQIMRADLEQRGVKFVYLDGSTKNRLEIVKQFNADPSILVFLVSLKAGGTGLNLTGADTVIHYDMWWNPAVESQATDRVHRIGQKQSVSVYKLVTLGTIEEKIVEMQNRKKGLVKKIVSCDDEAITKLTWEDVLELLQTESKTLPLESEVPKEKKPRKKVAAIS